MKALVLSGGGNYGAIQAGALQVLLEHVHSVDMVVGNSAGSLNAIRLAADPTQEGIQSLQDSWCAVTEEDVGSVNLLRGLQQLVLRGDSLFPNEPLVEFLERHLPQDIDTFGELRELNGIATYIVAANVRDGSPRVFGDRLDDLLLDGAMASTALPPYFAPWEVEGERYIDGGMYSNLPLRTAIDRGADEILGLWIVPPMRMMGKQDGLLQITGNAFNMMAQSLSAAEIELVEQAPVQLEILELHPPQDVKFWDFGQPERLIEAGREAARRFVSEKLTRSRDQWPTWLRRIRRAFGG
ncbi:MAG: patatin-like phospholipase family protein [Anaerolineales bacterium]|nr:patatin-like phospholipase family protein [Anaerolineales bacterium]